MTAGSRAGCERSACDPPVHPAVPPITCAGYSRREGDAQRRLLAREDPHSVRQQKFETGELVFIVQENNAQHGYVLPLSVARVDSVLADGFSAKVTYMWGKSWGGTFKPTELKPDSRGQRKQRFWTDEIDKTGVVLMRGGLTSGNTLNSQTKRYLKEVEESRYDEFSTKTATTNSLARRCEQEDDSKSSSELETSSEDENSSDETEAGPPKRRRKAPSRFQ
mmetsp:Transcript_34053/g.74479  ORF Transcript_34053/g.74479 Transcript_34053/m.74479 type:complete len:221 (+) Transcript_34053:973-1635(+)